LEALSWNVRTIVALINPKPCNLFHHTAPTLAKAVSKLTSKIEDPLDWAVVQEKLLITTGLSKKE
jgi:hypothetical protein